MTTLGAIRFYPSFASNPDNPGVSVQENIPDYSQKFVFSYNRTNFGVVNSILEFWDLLNQTPEANRHFYEVIPDRYQKLHFDIEIKNNPLEYAELVKDTLIQKIQDFISNLTFPENKFSIERDIILCTSHGTDQYAYHIVVDNFAFSNSVHCREASLGILSYMPLEMRKYILIPWNQQFQTWFSCRENETIPRYKVLEQNWIFLGKEIRWIPRVENDPRWSIGLSSYQVNYLYFERLLVSYFPCPPVVINYDISDTKDVNFEIGSINIPKLASLIPRGWRIDSMTDNFVRLTETIPTECPLCNKIHLPGHQYLIILTKKQRIFLRCYQSGVKSKYLGSLNPKYLYTRRDPPREISPKIPADQIYNSPYVQDLNPVEGITLISSYSGTGKTSAFINYIREHNFPRVLILSPGKHYTRSSCLEYNSDKSHLLPRQGELFQSYLENIDLRQANRLILQIDSLHKLVGLRKRYDVIILDEIEALMSRFSMLSTMKNLGSSVLIFERLIRETRIVLGADVFLSNKIINTLREINPHIQVIRNDYPPVARKAIIYPDYEDLTSKALDSLFRGKRIVFVCSSREKAEVFHEECKILGIISKFYRKSRDPVQQSQDFANINQVWSQVQCLIYTSTITVGVTFDLPDVFDELFVFGSSRTCSIRDTFQGMLRVRHLKDNLLHVAVNWKGSPKHLPTTKEKVLKEIQDLFNNPNSVSKFNQEHLSLDRNNSIKELLENLWGLPSEWPRNCHLENIAEKNDFKVNYKERFEHWLRESNYTIYRSINSEFETTQVNLRSEVYRYIQVPLIDERIYREIIQNISGGSANLFEVRIAEKYRFDRIVSNPEVKNEIYNFYFGANDPERKSQFFNIYLEKLGIMETYLGNEITLEFLRIKGIQLNIIKELNRRLGLEHSCLGLDIKEDEHLKPYVQDYKNFLDENSKYFRVESTARDNIIKVSNLLRFIYQKWNGCDGKRECYFRIKIKGLDTYFYSLTLTSNLQVWNSLTQWTDTRNFE